MPVKYLHVIAFNIPFPADYGGVIDIYYKLKALKQADIQVILHCYAYGRQQSKELEDLCFKVYYYPRNSGLKWFLSKDPYIVTTRNAKTMPKNVLGDHFPVLFEGLHSTALLKRCAAAGKLTIVRAHNIEHRYYRAISRSETRLLHKLFLFSEAVKLKPYEAVLKHTDHILGISRSETVYFEKMFGQAHFIPAFHRFEEVSIQEGTGDYILFHGNLGVPENSDVFLRIGQHVLSKTSHRVIVAGKNPTKQFLRRLSAWPNVEVIANPSDDEMNLLIRNAQVNLLYTAQATGIKLKLLHSLFGGRHCLVNREMVDGTGLAHLCRQADRPDEMISSLEELMVLPFTAQQINDTNTTLQDYSNRAGAEKILRLLS